MKKLSTGLARLKKLSAHLKRDKLGLDEFAFDVFRTMTSCGTAGCAVGECPFVFPGDWKFDKDCFSSPRVRGVRSTHPFDSAKKFFRLNTDECLHLFSPFCQLPESYGGKQLDTHATPCEVAANIDAFIKIQKHK